MSWLSPEWHWISWFSYPISLYNTNMYFKAGLKAQNIYRSNAWSALRKSNSRDFFILPWSQHLSSFWKKIKDYNLWTESFEKSSELFLILLFCSFYLCCSACLSRNTRAQCKPRIPWYWTVYIILFLALPRYHCGKKSSGRLNSQLC